MSDDRDVRDTRAQEEKVPAVPPVPPVASVPLPLLSLPPPRSLPYWNTVGLITEITIKSERQTLLFVRIVYFHLVYAIPSSNNTNNLG